MNATLRKIGLALLVGTFALAGAAPGFAVGVETEHPSYVIGLEWQLGSEGMARGFEATEGIQEQQGDVVSYAPDFQWQLGSEGYGSEFAAETDVDRAVPCDVYATVDAHLGSEGFLPSFAC